MTDTQDAHNVNADVDTAVIIPGPTLVPPSPGYDYRCQRCGHQWRTHKPGAQSRWCPKCHSASWDRPKKDKHVSMSAVGELVLVESKRKRRLKFKRVAKLDSRKVITRVDPTNPEIAHIMVPLTVHVEHPRMNYSVVGVGLEPPPGLRLPDPLSMVERTPENIIGHNRSGGNDE